MCMILIGIVCKHASCFPYLKLTCDILFVFFRSITDFKTEECKCAKLFAKHFKVSNKNCTQTVSAEFHCSFNFMVFHNFFNFWGVVHSQYEHAFMYFQYTDVFMFLQYVHMFMFNNIYMSMFVFYSMYTSFCFLILVVQIEEQQKYLSKNICHLGLGTPNRISSLLKSGT